MGASLAKDLPEPSNVEFGELGAILEMMWRGEQRGLSTGTVYQSPNHHHALRPTDCSSALVQHTKGDSRSSSRERTVSAVERMPRHSFVRVRREFLNTLRWTVAMPLAFSIAFVGWYEYRAARTPAQSDLIMNAGPAEFSRSKVAVAAGVPEEPQRIERGASSTANLDAGVIRLSEGRLVDAGAAPPVIRPSEARKPLAGLRTARALPSSHGVARRRVDPIAKATAETAPLDVTASCQGEMFLLRAVCINEQCARSQNAGQPSCAAAIRQRRIDEARRNPMLAG